MYVQHSGLLVAVGGMPKDWIAAREKCEEEGCCRYCGRPNPDAAHIIPRSLGGGQSKESIVPLCRRCHTQYDEGQLDILGSLTLEEQVEATRIVGLETAYRRLTGYVLPR